MSQTIVLGLGASIAAFKTAALASTLVKQGYDVHVVMTEHATGFVTPLTFEALTGNPCLVKEFGTHGPEPMEHIELARRADLMLIAPASADVIGKVANGIADDLLTTTVLACTCPVILAPAMNPHMFVNPAVQANIARLRELGHEVIDPASGHMACGDIGPGRMPEPHDLADLVATWLAPKDLAGLKIVVSAGATIERLDPVRYLTNHSTGRMGAALAEAATRRGATVSLVAGATSVPMPQVDNLVQVESAEQMFHAVTEEARGADVVIMAAAVADYRPVQVADNKIKKHDDGLNLELERTQDILAWLGEHKTEGLFLCGFSMETTDLIANSQAKLEHKHLDMIIANNLRTPGAGFGVDTNVVTVLTPDDSEQLPLMAKSEVADQILTKIRDARG